MLLPPSLHLRCSLASSLCPSIYTGFAVSYVSAIKVWNSAIVPILFVTCGLSGGLAILLAVMIGQDSAQIATLENVIRVVLIAFAIIVTVYLWNATYSSTPPRTP